MGDQQAEAECGNLPYPRRNILLDLRNNSAIVTLMVRGDGFDQAPPTLMPSANSVVSKASDMAEAAIQL